MDISSSCHPGNLVFVLDTWTTTTVLLQAISEWYSALDQSSNNCYYVAHLRELGLDPTACRWFTSFLTGRQQSTVINVTHSEEVQLWGASIKQVCIYKFLGVMYKAHLLPHLSPDICRCCLGILHMGREQLARIPAELCHSHHPW